MYEKTIVRNSLVAPAVAQMRQEAESSVTELKRMLIEKGVGPAEGSGVEL
jgi:hypothetical protein